MDPRPEDTIEQFSRCVQARDLEGIVQLYESEAAFVSAPGAVVTGREALRAMYGGLFSLRPHLDLAIVLAQRNGDLALIMNQWTLSGTAPDGTPVHRSGRSSVVLRRQATGEWLIAIDHP
jgi:uncharacterized protein (TIGR02246 family)